MKKAAFVLSIVSVAAVLVFFAACSSKPSAQKAGEVNLFIWTEYMPQPVLDAFEKETGIKVNILTYSSNEDMLAKIKNSNKGAYDIAVPSDFMVERMIKEGLLAKMDKSKIKNLNNIDPVYMNRFYDPKSEYGVPFMAGLAALIINKTKVTEKITSFNQVFSSKYKKQLVILNDYRVLIGAISMALGYKLDPTPEQLRNVDIKLQALKPNIKLRDSDSPKTAMLNGETAIGLIWNAEIAIAMQESDDFEVVFPDEGCYLFIDNMVILDGAKNIDNAHKFIEFILRPEISKMISDEYPYTNPNKAAVEILSASYKDNPASNVPASVIEKGQFPQEVGAKRLEQYDIIWTKFIK
ncbi:MAG: spermidine/putrescine ABC transporter substrate-binding protein [Elusimicrobiota bacterium]|jgi:spermidine/putrescine-binding protein|nr:spermidine/putrescine ABC transporter substrate-binding protein [Elusimicrobiota bacterium]